jgi:sporulation protein YlmC with PRC-barrel domain
MTGNRPAALLLIFMVISLVLSACAGDTADNDLTTPAPGAATESVQDLDGDEGIPVTGAEEVATPTTAAPEQDLQETPEGAENDQMNVTSPEEVISGDPLLQAAAIVPETSRADITQLSAFNGYTVTDRSGNIIGTVDDAVVNLCESHLIYLVVDAGARFGQDEGRSFFIPYEVLTLGNGVIDVENQAVVINMDAPQMVSPPMMQDRPDLSSADWEAEVRGYWSELATLSNLSTECLIGQETNPVTGEVGPVTRIAYTSEMASMPVYDGMGQLVGTTEDAIIEPESGRIRFIAIRLDATNGQGLAFAPTGAVNIDRAPETGDDVALVLLVEREILLQSPTFDAIPDTSVTGWDSELFGYWSQHVPMTVQEQGEPVGEQPDTNNQEVTPAD